MPMPAHDQALSAGSGARRPRHRQALGAWGEAQAETYLRGKGFSLLTLNWRCTHGELDLIMRDGKSIVAVEVKTRSTTSHGTPLEAITAQKAARLRRLLLEWARQSGTRQSLLRVDAVGITLRGGGESPRIDHLQAIS